MRKISAPETSHFFVNVKEENNTVPRSRSAVAFLGAMLRFSIRGRLEVIIMDSSTEHFEIF